MNKFIFALLLSFGSMYAAPKGLTLSNAYAMAVKNDNRLMSLRYKSDAESTRIDQAFAQFLPQISADAVYNGEFYERYDREIDESIFGYSINLRQSIYQPSLYANMNEAEIRYESTKLAYLNEEQNIAQRVMEAYFKVLYAQQAYALTNSYHKANEAKYEQIKKSFDMGLANKIDYLESKVRLQESQSDLNKELRNIEIGKLELWRLIGEMPKSLDNSLEMIDEDFFSNFDIESMEKKIEQNLDLRQMVLKHKLAQNEYQKRAYDYHPTLNLRASYGEDRYLDSAFGDELNKRKISLNFSIPLYQGGYRQARLQESLYTIDAAKEEMLDAKKEVSILFKQASIDLKTGVEQYKISKSASESAKVHIHSMTRGYEEGLKDLVDLLDAKARLLEIEKNSLDASYMVLISYVKLLGLIGEVSFEKVQYLDKSLSR